MMLDNEQKLSELLTVIKAILRDGNDVEIKACKDGYKVLEVQRKRALTIINNTKGNNN